MALDQVPTEERTALLNPSQVLLAGHGAGRVGEGYSFFLQHFLTILTLMHKLVDSCLKSCAEKTGLSILHS